MIYNSNFLIAAMIILLMVLLHFTHQKNNDDMNNRFFLLMTVLVSMDVVFEIFSTFYIGLSDGDSLFGPMFTTTVFYLFQGTLPLVLLCYIRTLKSNSFATTKKLLILSLPTLCLVVLILSNPLTGLLFSFDSDMNYTKGPCYMLMYYCALFHVFVAFCMIFRWRKHLGKVRIRVLVEILLLIAAGIIIQAICHPLLMTGFALSLSVLALFITINNPHANTDSLTGLNDKPYLMRHLGELFNRNATFHVIVVNIYQLAHINKIAGVEGGDHLLQRAAAIMQELCQGNVFRISGRRFLVLADSREVYTQYISQIQTAIQEDRKLLAEHIASPVTISGITDAGHLENGGTLLEYAEYLDSLASKTGITEVMEDNPQTMKSFLYNKNVEQFLHTAIAEDLFEIYYQPVYSLKDHQFVTLEALSRLKHPELGWVPPDIFIGLAEKTGLIDQITDLQFRRVCRFAKDHEEIFRQIRNIKVNLSALDLLQTECSKKFIRIMDEFDQPHSRFQFEITETVATEYNMELEKLVDTFVKAGVGLCLDDFGSGYANLNTVMRLPFSAIKLDRSLLYNICNDSRTASFYQSIVSAFQCMGYNVVSEGVETESEVKLLTGWGVDFIQGFYFSKPLPPENLLELIGK